MKVKPIKILVQYAGNEEVIDITDLDLLRYEMFLSMINGITSAYLEAKLKKQYGTILKLDDM